MTVAGRSSGRVTAASGSPLVGSTAAAVSGADREVLRGSSNSPATRLGRRGVELLRQQLSERDMAIVRSVADFRFLTALQLERLHFVDAATNRPMRRTARRVLARLAERRLLDRIDRRIGGLRAGSASFVYALGPVGHRLLRRPGARPRRSEPGAAFLAHHLAVAGLFLDLVEAARAGTVQIGSYQTEPVCWRSVPAVGGSVSLQPDLFVVLISGDVEWHSFVEVDLASEHRPAILRKCRQYQAYYQSGAEQAQRGVFPRVTWLTTGEERAAELRRIIGGAAGIEPALFAVGSLSRPLATLAPEPS